MRWRVGEERERLKRHQSSESHTHTHHIITSATEITFSSMSVCLFVSWLVGEQDCIKTTEQISVKLGGQMGFSPEWTPSTLSVDANGQLQECFQVAGILDPVSLNDTGLSSFILDWTNK